MTARNAAKIRRTGKGTGREKSRKISNKLSHATSPEPKSPELKRAKSNMLLKNLVFQEIGRKATHIVFGSIILILVYLDLIWLQGMALLIAASLAVSVISMRYKIPGIYFMLRNFERPQNLNNFPGKGAVFFLIGTLLSLILFDKDIALASIAILTFGDSVASFFNITYGRTKHPLAISSRKLVEGSLAGTTAGFFASLLFLDFNWMMAAAGSIVGMLFEAMEIRVNGNQVDDNVIVPLTAGVAMMLVRLFL